MTRCNCGLGFRYHALNCPYSPGEVLNRALHQRCQRDEAFLDRLRRAIARHLAARRAQRGETSE